MLYSSCDNMKKTNKKEKQFSKYLLLLILIIGSSILLNINKLKTIYLSHLTGYQEKTINTFLEEDIYKEIKENKYSKTLEEIIKTELYQEKFLLEYLNINYNESENFLKEISIFLNKGYNNQNINTIYKELNKESIETLLNEDYYKDINDIITITFFKEDKLKRYISYAKKETTKDLETIVTYVNIGLDNSYYTNIQKVDNPNDILVLVNKYNQLNESYIPENLQNITYGNGQLKQEAAIQFDKMCEDANKDGIKIYGGSGYRSYSYQYELYNNYVKIDGEKITDTYAARAGHSEHQTGLAMDILNKNWTYIQETNEEYNWLINNSYKYGFILRYPKNKEEITGYQFEPWHYRYVGIDLAKELYNLNITYDEYIAKK